MTAVKIKHSPPDKPYILIGINMNMNMNMTVFETDDGPCDMDGVVYMNMNMTVLRLMTDPVIWTGSFI